MTLNITRCLCFSSNTREYQYFDVFCPETSSCASKPLLLRCNLVIPQCMCQVSLRLKEVQMGAHDFKYNKVPLFFSKTREYQYFDVCCHDTSSGASKPFILRCNLVIPQLLCQVSLRLKEVQMGYMTLNITSCLFFARKQGNINTSMSAAPKLAPVPASRYYCDVTWSYHNVCAKLQ